MVRGGGHFRGLVGDFERARRTTTMRRGVPPLYRAGKKRQN
jgi:hypothetical protein